jgi:hypothetical protein
MRVHPDKRGPNVRRKVASAERKKPPLGGFLLLPVLPSNQRE